jgi:C1A family cysteine protease
MPRSCQRRAAGAGWGNGGYGWLPYEYALSTYAMDFWSLFGMRYADTDKFGLTA